MFRPDFGARMKALPGHENPRAVEMAAFEVSICGKASWSCGGRVEGNKPCHHRTMLSSINRLHRDSRGSGSSTVGLDRRHAHYRRCQR